MIVVLAVVVGIIVAVVLLKKQGKQKQIRTFLEATDTLKKAEAWARTASTLHLSCQKCGAKFVVGQDSIIQSARTMAEEHRQIGLAGPKQSEIETTDATVGYGECPRDYKPILLSEIRYLYQAMANNSVIHQNMQQAMNPSLQKVVHWICGKCQSRQAFTWSDVLLPNYWREHPKT